MASCAQDSTTLCRQSTMSRRFKMIARSLLLSAFVLLSGLIADCPKSLAATNDPASFVSDLASRALAPMPNDTAAVRQERFRQLFRQYFDVEACARTALGPYWLKATALQRQEFVELYEDYVVIAYSTALRPSAVKASRCWGASPIRKGSSWRAGSTSTTLPQSGSIGSSTRRTMATR
jgi:MlaC protein